MNTLNIDCYKMSGSRFCKYYIRGFCKFGSQCRKIHPQRSNDFTDIVIHDSHQQLIFTTNKQKKCATIKLINNQNLYAVTSKLRCYYIHGPPFPFKCMSIDHTYSLRILDPFEWTASSFYYKSITDGINKIMYRGCIFTDIYIPKISIYIKVKLFTKNADCFHLSPICNDRHIQLISLFDNNIVEPIDIKNSMNIISLILNEIYQCDFLLTNIIFQKMPVPPEIQKIFKVFYYDLMEIYSYEPIFLR